MSRQAVVAHLEALGVDYQVVECDPDFADTAGFCERYGYPMDASANAICVVGKSAERPMACCLVLASMRLNVNGVVRRRLGTRKASFADAATTIERTGMMIGGVTPFGLPASLPVWIDAQVMECDQVIVGGGSRDCKILCPPASLLAIEGAEIVENLARPAGGAPGAGIPAGPPAVIVTTTIGAYPKPAYVPISDWFTAVAGDEAGDYTSAFAREMGRAGSGREALFRRAAAEVIRDQVEAGIDIVTDGEVRRENYVHYQCRHFSGIDFDNPSPKTIRGVTEALLPTVRGEVRHLGTSPLVHDYRVAQSLSPRPVKVTIPGPMTIIDTTVDACYHDDAALGADLATAVNAQALELVDAGCRHIQVDEPVMARKPDIALAYGIEHLERCFTGLPEGVARVVHCCCGYPEHLDQDDYPKADPGAYVSVAEALDSIAVDAVSIEDAHRPNDLGALLPRFARTTVILGVLAVARSRLEAVDDVEGRLIQALEHLPPERLAAAPDCGLAFLGRDLARRKLAVMCEAVGRINSRLG